MRWTNIIILDLHNLSPEHQGGRTFSMATVLLILGIILALLIVPAATIMGLIGFWIFGFWGALIGIIIGLLWKFKDE